MTKERKKEKKKYRMKEKERKKEIQKKRKKERKKERQGCMKVISQHLYIYVESINQHCHLTSVFKPGDNDIMI